MSEDSTKTTQGLQCIYLVCRHHNLDDNRTSLILIRAEDISLMG